MKNTKMETSKQKEREPILIRTSDNIPVEELKKLQRAFVAYEINWIYCWNTHKIVDLTFDSNFIFPQVLKRIEGETNWKLSQILITEEKKLQLQFELKNHG